MSETKTNHLKSLPLKGISTPHDNDVPLDCGGFVNSHWGHGRYLQLVQDRQLEYAKCKRSHKKIAWTVVHELRAMEPPALFLRQNPSTGLWNDVGDKKFKEKVSQSLREHQPFIKPVIECDDSNLAKGNAARPERFESLWDIDTLVEPSASSPASDLSSTFLDTERRRIAFLSTRNETRTELLGGTELPNLENGDTGLSDIYASQGPSFEFLPKQRNSSSSRWEDLFAALANTSLESLDVSSCTERSDVLSFQRLSGWETASTAGLENQTGRHKTQSTSQTGSSKSLSRPEVSKWASCHKNKTHETKQGFTCGTAKWCLLDREKSGVSRVQKEVSFPGSFVPVSDGF